MDKRGQEVYYIRRRPGVPLAGATAWVYDCAGELRRECAVIAGRLMAGVQIDEDRALYFTSGRPKVVDAAGTAFLAGHGGTFGLRDDKTNRDPFTGTAMKTRPDTEALCLKENAAVAVDPLPDWPPDLTDGESRSRVWITGAGWLYAGASPVVACGCSCPSHRVCLDWYKRLYVPEAYRHSIGVVDTAGNLIVHIGRYGNLDDARRLKPGDTVIPMSAVRYISGTDNYPVFDDHGEGITVLRLAYHAEATLKLEAR